MKIKRFKFKRQLDNSYNNLIHTIILLTTFLSRTFFAFKKTNEEYISFFLLQGSITFQESKDS